MIFRNGTYVPPGRSHSFLVVRSCSLIFLLTTLGPVQVDLCAQTIRKSAASQTTSLAASSKPSHEPELQARLAALESAKQSGEPAAAANAARLVLGLALRHAGEIQLQARVTSRAIEIFRRSLDFEDSTAARNDLALAYMTANRLDEALPIVTEILTVNPQNARGWYYQGRIWMAKGLYDRAIESFMRSLSFESNPTASFWLGSAFLKAKHPEQAKAVFRKLLDESGNWAVWHARLADAYRSAGYNDDSVQEMNLAEQLDSKTTPKHHPKAPDAELIPEGNGNEIRESTRAAEGSPQRDREEAELRTTIASALNDLGTAEARQQQFSLALAHLQEAEGWDRGIPGLQRNIGVAAMRASNYAEAVRALRPVVAANPQDRVARATLGSALFATNSFSEAAETLEPLEDSVLEHPEVAYAWAESLVKTNQYAEATVLLTKLEVTQVAPQMLLLIAQAWSQMGIYPRAVEACHRALQKDSGLLAAHYLAGLALIRQDRPSEATQEFRDELKLDPSNTDAKYNLAFTLLQQSQEMEAVDLLKQVLARDPQHAEANYELGKQLFSSGNVLDAIPYLEAAARLKPVFEPVHYQLQAAYRAMGRKEDAEREAKIYRELKAKSRNITLPPPRD